MHGYLGKKDFIWNNPIPSLQLWPTKQGKYDCYFEAKITSEAFIIYRKKTNLHNHEIKNYKQQKVAMKREFEAHSAIQVSVNAKTHRGIYVEISIHCHEDLWQSTLEQEAAG